ncbi:hypothetical protein AVEN_34659-1 [Araneus ventricosus]|uniref:Uncharacterized protein n=1 Tax=Araneus ventricosus TaxID=182803 RepID=A0A4Y2B0A0_ARAVE|nr:hypothetical protein AVEN_34659-1 [Araneus ventricosus]
MRTSVKRYKIGLIAEPEEPPAALENGAYPVPLVWRGSLERGVPAQVSSSSSDQGSKLREMQFLEIEWKMLEMQLTEYREDDDTGKHGSAAVADGDGDGVSEAVVMHRVVGCEGDQAAEGQA